MIARVSMVLSAAMLLAFGGILIALVSYLVGIAAGGPMSYRVTSSQEAGCESSCSMMG